PRNERRGRAGELTAPVRRAVLVVDNAKLVALGGEALDRRQEIPAAARVHPARAEDERQAAGRFDGTFAFELARSVHVEWSRGRRFVARLGARAVEDVVGRIVDDECVEAP